MTTERDGGAAFPVSAYESGMSLRDWFAGQALQSIIVADGIQYAARMQSQEIDARIAYAFADAMLAERSKP